MGLSQHWAIHNEVSFKREEGGYRRLCDTVLLITRNRTASEVVSAAERRKIADVIYGHPLFVCNSINDCHLIYNIFDPLSLLMLMSQSRDVIYGRPLI